LLVFYKDTNELYLGRYTGNTTEPFRYERIEEIPPASVISHKHTLINVNGQYHIYAGHSQFWMFDLTNRIPTEFEPFQNCQADWFSNSKVNSVIAPDIETNETDAIAGQHMTQTIYTWSGLDPNTTYQLALGAKYALTEVEGFPREGKLEEPSTITITGVSSYALTIRQAVTPPTSETTEDIPSFEYDGAELSGLQETNLFTAHNPVTHEIFACGNNLVLRFDYRFGTVSTSQMNLSAMGYALKPESSTTLRQNQWVLFGMQNGYVMRYGKEAIDDESSGSITATVSGNTATASAAIFKADHAGRSIKFADGTVFAVLAVVDATHATVLSGRKTASQRFSIIPAIYHRDEESYDSIMASGLSSFGKSRNEKLWNEYTLILASQSPNASVAVDFRSGRNPGEDAVEQSTVIPRARTENMVQPTIQANYIGDRLTVAGVNNPVEIAERIFSVQGIGTGNVLRRNTNASQ
jgi:hypothetical protein